MTQRKKYIVFGTLIVSLALNLIILGGAGYTAYKFKNHNKEGWVERRIDRGERYFLKKLEGEDREIAQQIFAERRQQLKLSLRELHRARRDFGHAMRADTPSPDELVPILDRSEIAAAQANTAFHATLRDLALKLSPEARQKIGDHLRDHRPFHRDDD